MLRIRFGCRERPTIGFDDRALAPTDLDTPKAPRSFGGPLTQQSHGVVDTVALVGKESVEISVGRGRGQRCARTADQDDEGAAEKLPKLHRGVHGGTVHENRVRNNGAERLECSG